MNKHFKYLPLEIIDILAIAEILDERSFGNLIIATANYAASGTLPNINNMDNDEKMAFALFRAKIDVACETRETRRKDSYLRSMRPRKADAGEKVEQ